MLQSHIVDQVNSSGTRPKFSDFPPPLPPSPPPPPIRILQSPIETHCMKILENAMIPQTIAQYQKSQSWLKYLNG